MTERNLSIRLSVRDQETVRRALESLGEDGQAALRRIEQGGAPASRSLLAVNAASQEVQGGFAGLASQAGPVGNVLSALGPAGVAAAAGIAAVAMGLSAAIDRSRQAVEKFAEINKTADRLKISTAVLQELRYAAERVGIGAEAADEGLKELGIRAAEAAEGSGDAADGFKKLGITQADLKKNMGDMPALFELVASRLSQVKTAAERALLADAIFGDIGGEGLVVLLAKGADGIRQFRDEAQSLGVVIQQDMLDRATETNRQLSVMSTVIDSNLNQAFVDLAPLIATGTELLLGFTAALRELADASRELDRRSSQGIEQEISTLRKQMEFMREQDKGYPEWAKKVFGWSNEQNIAKIETRIAEMEAELKRRKSADKPAAATPPKKWDGKPADDYVKPDDDPVKDAKAQFKRAVENFKYTSDTWDAERETRDSLDQTARELMEYANKLREPQRKMLEEQAKDVQRLIEANTKARTDQIIKVGDAIDRSLQDNLSKSASGFQSWGDSVRAIIADVAQELIKMYMIRSTGNTLGGILASGIGALAGYFAGGNTPGTVMAGNTSPEGYFGPRDYGGLTTTGGPRAAGGQVFPDIWYPTNERRAEDTSTPGWFLPVRPGVISPDSGSGGGGGGAVTVQQNFTLSANGAGPSEVAQLRQMVADMAVNFEARTLSAIQGAKRSGKLRSMGISS